MYLKSACTSREGMRQSTIAGLMGNLYVMRAVRKAINNRLLSRDYRAYRHTRKPLLTANRHRLCLEGAQRWQNLTMAHWKHGILGDEFRFQLYSVEMAGLRYVVNLISASSIGARLIGYKLVVVRYTCWELFTVVANRLLCSSIDTSLVRLTEAFCGTP